MSTEAEIYLLTWHDGGPWVEAYALTSADQVTERLREILLEGLDEYGTPQSTLREIRGLLDKEGLESALNEWCDFQGFSYRTYKGRVGEKLEEYHI